MIEIDSLYKSFGAEQVLRGLSLRLNDGEFAALIGTSGAGKTVLARCIVGLEAIDGGRVTVDGLSLGADCKPDNELWTGVRKKVSLVSQNRALPPYRNVLDQIIEGPRYVLRLNRADALERARPWIERLGISEHLHKYPSEISGGQLTRVCLARAAVMNPAHLICDEVTANLDPFMAAEVARALIEVAATGVSVLLISHQIEFIRQHASVVHFLHRGKVACSGSPAQVMSEPPNEALRQYLQGTSLGR